VLSWLDTARECFSDDYGSLQRGFLTSVFALIVGLERVFHLDQMQDVGFALLTGDARHCPSRHDVGAWRRHVLWNEVDRFCHRTSPWELLHNQDVRMSFDEHSVPRWTKKFVIPKGYVTTRNKFMRCEKLYLGYEVNLRRFATIKATPGNVELRDVSGLLTRRVLRYGQPASLHALFDAGAGKSDADVRALMNQAAATENLEVTLRACRYPSRVERWKTLPPAAFTIYEEPGVCQGAPPKEIRIAETRTVLKDETEREAVRTVVCRQVIRGPKKDRWHRCIPAAATKRAKYWTRFASGSITNKAFACRFTMSSSMPFPVATTRTVPIAIIRGSIEGRRNSWGGWPAWCTTHVQHSPMACRPRLPANSSTRCAARSSTSKVTCTAPRGR
jgi:hypothetical protein